MLWMVSRFFLQSAGRTDMRRDASPIRSGAVQAQCLESCIFIEIVLLVILAVKHMLNGLHMLVHLVNEFCLFTNEAPKHKYSRCQFSEVTSTDVALSDDQYNCQYCFVYTTQIEL